MHIAKILSYTCIGPHVLCLVNFHLKLNYHVMTTDDVCLLKCGCVFPCYSQFLFTFIYAFQFLGFLFFFYFLLFHLPQPYYESDNLSSSYIESREQFKDEKKSCLCVCWVHAGCTFFCFAVGYPISKSVMKTNEPKNEERMKSPRKHDYH